MDERRVYEGGLGCRNCREVYPVEGGVADLRVVPRRQVDPVDLEAPSDEELGVASDLGDSEPCLVVEGKDHIQSISHGGGLAIWDVHATSVLDIAAYGREEGYAIDKHDVNVEGNVPLGMLELFGDRDTV